MPQNDVTSWLVAWGKGDPAADSRLMEAVYADLRRVARRRLRAERGDHSLTPTALVHEAYVRLVDLRRVRWQNRVQFFAIAARLMRRVLVDHARGHAALKRGGARWKVSLSDHVAVTPPRDVELLDLAVALNKLGTINPRLTDLVVMRFFGGLTIEETAEVVQSSPATVKRDWIRARAWLFRELRHAVAARSDTVPARQLERPSVTCRTERPIRVTRSRQESPRMISDNWEDVFAVFDAALSTSGVERDEFLERECGDNARLRDKVESLLAAHRDAEGFLSGGQVRATRASGGPSSPVSRILAPGTRIGVFEVESFAGAGGMGEVYRARDTRLDRHVALKILSPDATTDLRGRARLAYEARAIARLSHPHICALHDIGHHDGVDFLVMEYLDGETLASRLRRAPLPVAEAVRIAIQIADALDAAHAEGIVHSDLKPANIMLVNGSSDRDGEPESKLLDFGLARFQPTPRISEPGMPAADHTGSTRRGVIAGTPQYMAPEQVRGEEADPRSDIFSFGCVLYEMVSGRAAFAGGTARGCHVRDPPCRSIGPADRSVSIGEEQPRTRRAGWRK